MRLRDYWFVALQPPIFLAIAFLSISALAPTVEKIWPPPGFRLSWQDRWVLGLIVADAVDCFSYGCEL